MTDAEVYLVLEYENRVIYIPFRKLEYVDAFTCGYENPQELCKVINDYLELGIPDDEMLDAYLSENISKVYDDSQENYDRHLAIQYSRHIFDYNELIYKLGNVIKHDTGRIRRFSGLQNVIDNYTKKNCKNRPLLDSDPEKIVKDYFKDNYKRKKASYFILSDMGYKFRRVNPKIDKTKTGIQLAEEEKDLFCYLVDMRIDDLKEYVALEERKGMHR